MNNRTANKTTILPEGGPDVTAPILTRKGDDVVFRTSLGQFRTHRDSLHYRETFAGFYKNTYIMTLEYIDTVFLQHKYCPHLPENLYYQLLHHSALINLQVSLLCLGNPQISIDITRQKRTPRRYLHILLLVYSK